MRHVLDLAPLYTRPDAATLLETLDSLTLRPATFDGLDRDDSTIAEEGVPSYLTSIVSSALSWLPSDASREQVWELASQRLAERSGRTAQPSFRRKFTIPTLHSPASPLEIQLQEPSMTGDNLGLKTWAAAYLLAKRLPALLPRLPALSPPATQVPSSGPTVDASSRAGDDAPPLPRILELGAGTGLVGLAVAQLVPCVAHLTDLPAIVPNLVLNIEINEEARAERQPRSVVEGFGLDWAELPPDPLPEAERYDVVLVADPLYSPEHPRLVVGALEAYLKKDAEARVVVEVPLREAYVTEREELKVRMKGLGLGLVESGEESGFDDWGDGGTAVVCWWAVWEWK